MKSDRVESARNGSYHSSQLVGIVAALTLAYVAFIFVLSRRLAGQVLFWQAQGVSYALYGRDYHFSLGAQTEALLALLVVLESIVLWFLYRTLRDVRIDRFCLIVFALATIVMSVVSFEARFTSSDVYHYIFYGKSASLKDSYSTAPHPQYPPGYGALSAILVEPVPPSVYGPLWQAGDRAVIGRTHTLDDGVRALRLCNLVALFSLVAALLALRVPSGVVGAIALNPALHYLFVVQASNDAIAVAALALGVAVLRRNAALAVALGVVAGLIKVSTIGVALATLCTAGILRTRLLAAVAMLAGFVVISLLVGGLPYVHAMQFVGEEQTSIGTSRALQALRLGIQGFLAILVLATIVASIGFRRFVPSSVFAFPAVSGILHAQYFAWGLPYAVANPRVAGIAASLLPLYAFFIDGNLVDALKIHFLTPVLALVAAYALLQVYRRTWAVPLPAAP